MNSRVIEINDNLYEPLHTLLQYSAVSVNSIWHTVPKEKHVAMCLMWWGSVMVWAAITFNHKFALVFVDGTLNSRNYINNILQPVAIPYIEMESIGPQLSFQENNAPPDAAKIVQEFHRKHYY